MSVADMATRARQFSADQPHDVSAKAVAQFNRFVFKRMAEKYGGECTLNEVRVMNQIICCSLDGRTCGVTALHKATGIPIPTVSRAVTNLQSEGWLAERQHPTDGRKRVITLGPRSTTETWNDIKKLISLISDFPEHGLSN
jgi:DNA-binding MarR family transcriptional regulator